MLVHAAVPPQLPHGTAVAASLFDHPCVVFAGLQISQVVSSGLAAPLPQNLLVIQQPV